MKFYKQIIKIVVSIAIIVGLGLVISTMYVYQNQSLIISKFKKAFKENYNTHISVEKISLNIWKQFPYVGFEIEDITIQDKNWYIHKHNLLEAQSMFVQIKLLPLISGKFKVHKLLINDGSFYLFKDSFNHSNFNILQNHNRINSLKEISLRKVRFKYINEKLNKKFDFNIQNIDLRIQHKLSTYKIRAVGVININNLSFNTNKGAFFSGASMSFDLVYFSNTKKKTLGFNNQIVNIDNKPINFSALFRYDSTINDFKLEIRGNNLDYNQSRNWLSNNIKKPLKEVVFKKPINVNITLSGKLVNQPNPYILVKSDIVNNVLTTKYGTLENAYMQVYFNNHNIKSKVMGDANSAIYITNLKANYKGVNFEADSCQIKNLKTPFLDANIFSKFDLTQLNKILSNRTFKFTQGKVDLRLHFKGNIAKKIDSIESIFSNILISNAALEYLPRYLKFYNTTLHLTMNKKDVHIVSSTFNTESSQIKINANAKNFFKHYVKQPEQILIKANVKSNYINLQDFDCFFGERNRLYINSKIKNSNKIDNPLSNIIDNVFDKSTTEITLNVDSLKYKKIGIRNLFFNVNLLPEGLIFKHTKFNYAGGSVIFSGQITDNMSLKRFFKINVSTQNIDLATLLYVNNNIGTFTSENTKGALSFTSSLSGHLTKEGKLERQSLNGKVNYKLENIALISLKPVIKFNKFFNNKLNLIKIPSLQNIILINSNKIIIPTTPINTNVISLFLSTTFVNHKLSKLLVEIPLFQKSKQYLQIKDTFRNGYCLYIEGREDSIGNFDYNWKIRNPEIFSIRSLNRKHKSSRVK